MKAWQAFSAWWLQRSRREHAVLLLACGAFCLAVLDGLAWGPTVREQAQLQSQIASAQQQRRLLTQQAELSKSNRAAADREEAALRQRIVRADSDIRQIRQSVTPPSEMVQRLREISGQGSAVKLVGLVAEPAEPLFGHAATAAAGPSRAAQAASVPTAAPSDPAMLYRLPVLVTLEGDYTALHDYLHTLEAGSRGLRWRSLELQTQAWPKLRLKLRVFTIGEQPTWQL